MNLFLRMGEKNNSCIRVTQENSIENSVQDSLSYTNTPWSMQANSSLP